MNVIIESPIKNINKTKRALRQNIARAGNKSNKNKN